MLKIQSPSLITIRMCKNGHDLSEPESRASNRACWICRTAKSKIYDKKRHATPERKYAKYKTNLQRHIRDKYQRLAELEESLNAEKNGS